ncbi:MAG: hydrogenase iron-sulfur subunit [Deltaproteobacteria bacterium]|nr:MAG: hydrogenase iron-sulfur subunit [Deltaproteobacteria bacterium]
MGEDFKPTIIGFVCNWCTYAGADLAGTSRLEYPANIRLIRLPCSGRIDPLFIFRAFLQGADGVLVSGCHPGDCHYTTGNYYAKRRLAIIKRLLEYIGLEPGRLRLEWISASEGQRFADVCKEFTARIKELGPQRRLRQRTAGE